MSKFDQRGQKVETQLNINIESDKPSITELKDRGLQLLNMREYQLALANFEQLLNLSPQSTDIQYYVALALLKGQRPRLVTFSVVKEIEQRLHVATKYNSKTPHCFILWAIVKEDYYVLNGLYDTPPTVSELLRRANSVEMVHINEMLTHIHAPNNRIWEWLHSIC